VSSLLELCKVAEREMREKGARMLEEIADSLKQSLQEAAMAASAAAATRATTERQTKDMVPASHINLDRGRPAANALVDGAQGLPERMPGPSRKEFSCPLHRPRLPVRASSQPHPLELALEHRVDGMLDGPISPTCTPTVAQKCASKPPSAFWPRFKAEV